MSDNLLEFVRSLTKPDGHASSSPVGQRLPKQPKQPKQPTQASPYLTEVRIRVNKGALAPDGILARTRPFSHEAPCVSRKQPQAGPPRYPGQKEELRREFQQAWQGNWRRPAMFYRLSADAVLLLHFTFIAFVLFGAMLALRWRWVVAAHLPAAAWGFFVELTGRICPLTYVENYLRNRAGQSGYSGGFIEHYLLPVIYPAGLTQQIQFVLAGVVVIVNGVAYGWLLLRRCAL